MKAKPTFRENVQLIAAGIRRGNRQRLRNGKGDRLIDTAEAVRLAAAAEKVAGVPLIVEIGPDHTYIIGRFDRLHGEQPHIRKDGQ